MSELSHFIFESLINETKTGDIPFEYLRDKTYDLAQSWFSSNPDKLERIGSNFTMFTKRSFKEHRLNVIRGISDHYADKIALVTYSYGKIKKLFSSVIYSEKEMEGVKSDLKKGFNVILAGSHFGGIEWSAAILSILGLPCAIIANFKTKEARDKAFAQSKYFNVDVIDINDDNRKYFEDLKEKPGCIITVMDAFDRWVRSNDSHTINIFGRDVLLDRRIDYFAGKIRSKVYWLALKPDSNRNFVIEMKRIKPERGSYIKVLMDEWIRTVKDKPESLYNWDEVSLLIDDRRSKV